MKDKPTASNRMLPRHRLMRVIGRSGPHGRLSPFRKTLLFFVLLFLLSVLLAWLDPRPTLRHVRLTILSGASTGNYHTTVDRLAAEVARQRGSIRNQATAGSAENVQRLVAARASCEFQFALVQGGTLIPEDAGLELLGRLPQPESLIILGRDLERVRTPLDLSGMRIGIGPVGSGTEQMMRRLLAQVPELQLVVATPTIDQQLDMLVRGELELGAMVIDEGAALVRDAVVRRGLQILDMPEAAALARRLAFARAGTIDAGQIDYVRRLPPRPLKVLQMDTLIVGNGCAKNGATVGLLTALSRRVPGFRRTQQGAAQPDGPADVRGGRQLPARRGAGRARHLCALGRGHPAPAHLDPAGGGAVGAVQRDGHRPPLQPVAHRRAPREDRTRDPGAVPPGRDAGRDRRHAAVRAAPQPRGAGPDRRADARGWRR